MLTPRCEKFDDDCIHVCEKVPTLQAARYDLLVSIFSQRISLGPLCYFNLLMAMGEVQKAILDVNGYDASREASKDDATSRAQLLEVARVILQQAVEFLEQNVVSNDQLTATSRYMPGSTIGKHLRHAKDHFALLLDSVSSPLPHTLSYDVRVRNTPMETSRQAAIETLKELIVRLGAVVPKIKMEETITLHAVTPYHQVFETTFGRELWFAELHAIHHWSMVRVIAGEQGMQLEETFGFAPSTLVHAAKNNAGVSKSKI